jgi:hypothetical protein
MYQHINALLIEELEGVEVYTVDRLTGIISLQVRNPNNRVAFEDCGTSVFCKINTEIIVATFQNLLNFFKNVIRCEEAPVRVTLTAS